MDQKKGNEAISAFAVKNQEEAEGILEQFIAVAHVDSVFGQPVTAGDYTVITASEVSVAMGIGYGTGYGTCPEHHGDGETKQSGAGGGGGGGGVSIARPVATINISSQGVTVVPVLDITKITIAALTAAGSIILVILKMIKGTRYWH